MAWCFHQSTYYTPPLPKDWGLEKFTSIFYLLMVCCILGKVLSDLARVTELEPVHLQVFSGLNCLACTHTLVFFFFPLNCSVGSVTICQHISKLMFLIARIVLLLELFSHFEGMLEFSEGSGKELADIWDFLDWSHLQTLSIGIKFLKCCGQNIFSKL